MISYLIQLKLSTFLVHFGVSRFLTIMGTLFGTQHNFCNGPGPEVRWKCWQKWWWHVTKFYVCCQFLEKCLVNYEIWQILCLSHMSMACCFQQHVTNKYIDLYLFNFLALSVKQSVHIFWEKIQNSQRKILHSNIHMVIKKSSYNKHKSDAYTRLLVLLYFLHRIFESQQIHNFSTKTINHNVIHNNDNWTSPPSENKHKYMPFRVPKALEEDLLLSFIASWCWRHQRCIPQPPHWPQNIQCKH